MKQNSEVADIVVDSTVLAHVMKTLNDRYQYGLDLFLLSIDEGITGYRDDSLEVTESRPATFYNTDKLLPRRSSAISNNTTYH